MEAVSQVVIDEARWQIVLAREVCSNERFVYASAVDRCLLPAGMPVEAAAPRKCDVLSGAGCRGEGWFPALPALPSAEFAPGVTATRHDRKGLPLD